MVNWLRSILGDTRKLWPIEVQVLKAISTHLPEPARQRMLRQVESVNKVQRFAEGKEVNLYHMVDGKPAFDESLVFANRAPEVRLATVKLRTTASSNAGRAESWLAHGRIFSITFDVPPKSKAGDSIAIESVRLWTDPMEAENGPEAQPATPSDIARLKAWLGELANSFEISDAMAPPAEASLMRQLASWDYTFSPDVRELLAMSGGFRVGQCAVHGLSSIRTIVLESGEFIILAEKASLEMLAMLRNHDDAFYRLTPDAVAPVIMSVDLRASLGEFCRVTELL